MKKSILYHNHSGFTLVELMVVVAIIGLLSAVAIPNFKKYQSKSRVAEAKLQLSAVYTAEQSFFSDFNIYGSCLPYMGFDPTAEYLSRHYVVGFQDGTADMSSIDANAYQAAVNSGLNSSADGCPQSPATISGATTGTRSANSAQWFPAGKSIGNSVANRDHLPDTLIGAQSGTSDMVFTVGAAGVISSLFVQDYESSALTINQNKELKVLRSGF